MQYFVDKKRNVQKSVEGETESLLEHAITGSRLTEWRRSDIDRDATCKNKGLTTVGLLHGRGTVCSIRSDRYCTPPYNLHGLMTSITLLRGSAALRTARVVHSLGHGPDTRFWRDDSRHGRAEHTETLAERADTQSGKPFIQLQIARRCGFCYALRLALLCILLTMRSGIRRAKSLFFLQLLDFRHALEINNESTRVSFHRICSKMRLRMILAKWDKLRKIQDRYNQIQEVIARSIRAHSAENFIEW